MFSRAFTFPLHMPLFTFFSFLSNHDFRHFVLIIYMFYIYVVVGFFISLFNVLLVPQKLSFYFCAPNIQCIVKFGLCYGSGTKS